MKYEIVKNKKAAAIYLEEEALTGVVKIAHCLADDFYKVTDVRPNIEHSINETIDCNLVVMTHGASEIAKNLPEVQDIKGKREVYKVLWVEGLLPNVAHSLVICGSDKRGTIYGMFYISEMLGVSPWVDFADCMPCKKETITFTKEIEKTSKEPSVKYRGFFINDEWPSFGNWTNIHHGGFTASMYKRVFELLLRLKGNYLWPAMWSSSFCLDGPGMESADLANEYGVVMGNSHHEPCLRAGEEFSLMQGVDSIYGNEWNYATNKTGLLQFWKDGLIRGGQREQIITIGMRGERDTTMLGPNATLKENIDLLREIIVNQRKLIKEHINEDIASVPQLLALYKEVEAYFYGNEQTKGLIGWDELSDVILLLCEDNFGNMRTLPTEEMRKHPGGYGMYYHFDYHGGPISYEWVNSSPLPKVWEQMTQAYEFGVRDLWIVNVGDLKPQELPLSYFLDLAYDYDAYGINHPNETFDYIEKWTQKQFGGSFAKRSEKSLALVARLLRDYPKMNAWRRPEALNKWTYHLTDDHEAGRMIYWCENLMRVARELREGVDPKMDAAYFQLVFYPTIASANVVLMQIYSAIGEVLVANGEESASIYAQKLQECIALDKALIEEYHSISNGKWDGMMLSKHVGFISWNDEGASYPTIPEKEHVSEEAKAYSEFSLEALILPEMEEKKEKRLNVENTYVVFEAGEVAHIEETEDAEWVELFDLGRGRSAYKVFPITRHFDKGGEAPALIYEINCDEAQECELTLHLSPSNPCEIGGGIRYGLSINEKDKQEVETIPEGFVGGDTYNWLWSRDVLNHIRKVKTTIFLQKGLNTIAIRPIDPGFVLQKIVIAKKDTVISQSYLGPL